MKDKIVGGTFIFFLAICSIFTFFSLRITPVTLKREIFIYEYGDPISTNVADYVNATDLVLKDIELNLVDVKNEIGIYPAYVKYAGEKLSFFIKIQDTTKPVVTLKQVVFNINTHETIKAINLLDKVEDNSDIIANFLLEDGSTKSRLTFDEKGSYIVHILVEDSAGNQAAKLRAKIVVGHLGNYPTLQGIEDIEIIEGSEFDALKNVSASDGNGNDITSNIRILKNNVDSEKQGVYSVIYSITNKDGNTLQRTRKVEVIKNEVKKK